MSIPDDTPSHGCSEVFELPMFPLGTVLFPGGVLPLHIFELRYQQMLNEALEADRRFGVVLITKGSEVGGGELRSDIGTIAHIEDYQRFDDGRAAVVSRGTTVCRVEQWLDDDPYPRAMVSEVAVEPEGRDDRELLQQARAKFDSLIELGLRLGRLDAVPEADWVSGLEEGVWELAGRAPCTAYDQQSILSSETRADRLRRISELLQGVYNDLELMGGVDGPS